MHKGKKNNTHRLKSDTAGDSGFTLLEVMVALAIFTVGILGVATMQVTAINSNASARMQTEATSMAAAKMEYLHSLEYKPSVTDPELDAANNASHIETRNGYRIQWTIDDNEVAGNIKTIQIVVRPLNPVTRVRPVVLNFRKARN